MSFSSIRRLILPAALIAASIAVPAADAVPPVDKHCSTADFNDTVEAYGATFAIKAWQNTFIPQYASDCPGTNEGTVFYNQMLDNTATRVLGPRSGSGLCVTAVTTQAPPTVSHTMPNFANPYTYPWSPFCGSDDPLTTAQWQQANGAPNPGLVVNQIPVAAGSNAIVYNDGAATCPTDWSLTSGQLSGIFAGTITNYNQVGCAGSQTITRVVRNAGSGTTCIFKSYLAKRNPDPWVLLNQNTGCGSTTWPAGSTTIVQANGNPGLVSTVTATAGAISYPDLASNVSATGTLINPVARVKTIQQEIQGVTGELPYLGSATAVGASNCQGNSSTPAHTSSPGWDTVTISDGPQGYPVCGFTYAFVYTRCTVHGEVNGQSTVSASAKCKIAADLIISSLEADAQAELSVDHYSPLPQNVLVVARAGAQTIV